MKKINKIALILLCSISLYGAQKSDVVVLMEEFFDDMQTNKAAISALDSKFNSMGSESIKKNEAFIQLTNKMKKYDERLENLNKALNLALSKLSKLSSSPKAKNITLSSEMLNMDKKEAKLGPLSPVTKEELPSPEGESDNSYSKDIQEINEFLKD